MYNLQSNAVRLDDLLNRIAASLQLDETRRQKMETAYNAVSDWINSDEGFFKDAQFEIYPHGSALIGTTVKPTVKEEFDLDFVIHIVMDWSKHNPFKIYNELKRRLNEHDTYKQMLVPKNRVLRLDYAGDFHIDIMPGCQETDFDVNRIRVPDKKRQDWVSSNPRGYGEWFNNKADSVHEFILEKAYAREDLPNDEPAHLKKPLKRAVQLIKRARDIYFENDSDNATSSIILTTLAGHFYNGEGSIYDTINNIVSEMHRQALNHSIQKMEISNPVNPDEKFTDKWSQKPMLFPKFLSFIKDFKEKWDSVKKEYGVKTSNEDLLKKMFGEQPFTKAYFEQDDYIQKAFPTASISTNSGLRDIASKSKPYSK